MAASHEYSIKHSLIIRDVVIVESSKVDCVPERKFGRMKLLQFSENHRPAYWGTWNKKTTIIRPRNPWAQDRVNHRIGVPHGGGLLCAMFHHDAHALFSLQNLLDYEVDSDDEWEEEEPGESLSHSEGVSTPVWMNGISYTNCRRQPLYSWLMWVCLLI